MVESPQGFPSASVWDRAFLHRAIVISCVAHALVMVVASVRSGGWSMHPRRRVVVPKSFSLVYADDKDDARSRWSPEVVRRMLTRHIIIPGPSASSHASAGGAGGQKAHPATQERLNRLLDLAASSGAVGGSRGAASAGTTFGHDADGMVDLTDVAAAAQGDPVRLAYFSAIREQVQQTADTQAWAAEHAQGGGLVYVRFGINETGRIHSAAILQDRSRAAAPLCHTAVRLVTASDPFPPFPPSFEDSNLTVLLPIEFVAESSSL